MEQKRGDGVTIRRLLRQTGLAVAVFKTRYHTGPIENLRLKPAKCKFFQTSIDILEFHVSPEGVSTQPEKVAAVVDWPPCENVEIKAFFGLSGYYRQFIKDYAFIAKPITDLLKPGVDFVWSADSQQAMDRLKSSLLSADVLALPRLDYPYILDTDASDYAIGAVLSQQYPDGSLEVVAYASRKLTPAETNYCVIRREFLAIVHYLKYFRHLLLGSHVTLCTDHSPLVWFRRIKDPTGQQVRWQQIIEEFGDDL